MAYADGHLDADEEQQLYEEARRCRISREQHVRLRNEVIREKGLSRLAGEGYLESWAARSRRERR
jgi:hypothetical protein